MGLCLTVRSGDIVKIGDALIALENHGSIWRINIKAPKDVQIERVKAELNEKNEIVYKTKRKK